MAREISDEEYEQVLNEVYGVVKLGHFEWDAGYLIREMDPTAFRCGKADYEDTLEPEKVACDMCGDDFEEEELEDYRDESCCAGCIEDDKAERMLP